MADLTASTSELWEEFMEFLSQADDLPWEETLTRSDLLRSRMTQMEAVRRVLGQMRKRLKDGGGYVAISAAERETLLASLDQEGTHKFKITSHDGPCGPDCGGEGF